MAGYAAEAAVWRVSLIPHDRRCRITFGAVENVWFRENRMMVSVLLGFVNAESLGLMQHSLLFGSNGDNSQLVRGSPNDA